MAFRARRRTYRRRRPYKKTYRRRYFKRRRNNYRRRRYSKLPRGIPYKNIIKLTYTEALTVNVPPAGQTYYAFRANSCRDPNAQLGGHGPRYWDEWMNLYGKAYVLASQFAVRITFPQGENSQPLDATIFVTDDPNLPFNFNSYSDINETKGRVAQRIYGYAAQHANQKQLWIKARFNSKKFFHLKSLIGQADYAFDTASNPVKQAYYAVHLASSTLDDPSLCRFEVRMSYTVMFTNPRYVAGSGPIANDTDPVPVEYQISNDP